MASGTMTLSDLYGATSGSSTPKTTAQGNSPNAAPTAATAGSASGQGPAFSWLVLVGVLVVLRFVYERHG